MGALNWVRALPVLALLATLPAWAETRVDATAALETSEAALGNQVGSYTLIDSRGERLPLDRFRGKPLVISLVYTHCASVCPVTTQHVRQAVASARKVLGADTFSVLTVGFDTKNDTPEQLTAFASTQGLDLGSWHLASADPGTMMALLRDVGFSYDAAAGGYEHLTQTTILDAQGRVYRQVYGDSFPDPIFIEPLKELVFGTETRSLTLTGLIDRIKFICTVYNPSARAYEFDYAIGFGIVIGGLSLILSGLVVFRLWRGNQTGSAP